MAVPNTFASATTSIPLANLDANFAYYDAAYSIVSTTVNFLGNVGVGTASPSAKLTVNGFVLSGGQNYSARFSDAVNSTYSIAHQSGLTNLITDTAMAFYSSNTERMRIDSSGNLGLGVTPSAWATVVPAFQIGGAGGYIAAQGSAEVLRIGSNNYYNSGFKYVINGNASRYDQTGGTHIWYTAPSGTAGNAITFTQAMTLTASNNLLLGTTTDPAYSGYTTLALNNATNGGLLDIQYNGTRVGSFQAGSATELRMYAGSGVASTFYAGGSERARITSGGYFKASNAGTYHSSTGSYHELRQTIDETIAFFVNTSATLTGTARGLRVSYTAASPNDTNNYLLYCDDSTTLRAGFRSNGGLANYSANDSNLSDRREKTNFAPATSYLDKICAIPVQTFNYIDQNLEEDGGLTLGVVAQDVQAVAPELVMESNWAGQDQEPKMRLSIYQTDLQYALMKALQELKAEFDAYKASHP